MDRLTAFHGYESHAWLGRLYKKLTADDLNLCIDFINQNWELDKNDFEKKVNRLFLDKEKTKNWKLITELLICANSASGGE